MRDVIRSVYPNPSADATQAAKTRQENRIEAIMTRLYAERNRLGIESPTDPFEANGYEAMMAIQGYQQHDAPRQGSPDATGRLIASLDDVNVSKATAKVVEMALA